jgi:PilZ domain-containing protein
MSFGCDDRDRAKRHEHAALATDIRIRVLNVSAAGCLVETQRQLEVGTVATLRLTFAGGDFEDTVQVVRCQEIKGAAVYQVGTTFLTTAAPSVESLRYLIRRESGRSSGYMRLLRKD